MYQNPRQKSRILEAKYLFGIKLSFSIAVALLTACVWAQYFRLTSKNHIIPLSYRIFTFASAICFVFLTSEIIHNPKTCSLRGRRHFLPPSLSMNLSFCPFQAQVILQCDKHYAFPFKFNLLYC